MAERKPVRPRSSQTRRRAPVDGVPARIRKPRKTTTAQAPSAPARQRRPLRSWVSAVRPGLTLAGDSFPPVQLLPLLAGLAAGFEWHGLRGSVTSCMDPLDSTTMMLTGIALLAAAVGPWFPERILTAVSHLRARRRARKAEKSAEESFHRLQALPDRDASLLWVTLALLAAVTGAVVLVTLAACATFSTVYRAALENFFWTDLSLACLDWTAAALLTGPCWVFNGIMAAMIAPGLHTGGRSRFPAAAPWLMLGAGIALCLGQRLVDSGLSSEQVLLLGVIPIFGIAALAAWRAQHLPATVPTESEDEMPELAPEAEWLIWLLLVVWGIACVLLCTGWLGYSVLNGAGLPSGLCRIGLFFAGTALGMGIGMIQGHPAGSASGCGIAMWGAGIVTAGAASLTAAMPLWAAQPLIHLVLVALPLGYALRQAERAWSTRVGREGPGPAQLTTAVLCGLGIGCIVTSWCALPLIGAMGVTATGSLLLMAFGGILQIHEKDGPLHVRHRRLAMIFASLSAVILLFPWDVRQWARWERHYSLAGPAVITGLDGALPPESIGASAVCMVTESGQVSMEPRPENARLLRFSSRVGPAAEDPGRTARSEAFRVLRRERTRYNLFYQQAGVRRATSHFPQFSLEWFQLIASRTIPSGHFVLDLNPESLTPASLEVIVRTLEEGLRTQVVWTIVHASDEPLIRIVAQPGSDHLPETPARLRWPTSAALLPAGARSSVHSLHRDRLTSSLRGEPLSVARLASMAQR